MGLHAVAGARRVRRGAAARALAGCLTLAFAFAGASAPGAHALIWTGGFETGDLSQWTHQEFVPGDMTLVVAPVRGGTWAAKVVVHPGDNPIAGSAGDRAELDEYGQENTGVTSWWGWSTEFPDGFYTPPYSKWNVFAQWHPRYSTLKPNLGFTVVNWGPSGTFLQLIARGGDPSAPTERTWKLGQLVRNRWYDFVLRVDWYPDDRGSVKLWVNGILVVPRTFTPTFYASGVAEVYAKQGLYRGPFTQDSTLYQDAMRRGTSYADVVAGLSLSSFGLFS